MAGPAGQQADITDPVPLALRTANGILHVLFLHILPQNAVEM